MYIALCYYTFNLKDKVLEELYDKYPGIVV